MLGAMGIFIGKMICKVEIIINSLKATYKRKQISKIGANSRISADVQLKYPNNIEIGDNTYINGGMIAASPNAKIVIGNDCLISYAVHLRTDMHICKDKKLPINKQGYKEADIIIGNDVWIGYGVQIISGVIIGDGAVVGAGAVVTKNLESYKVYAGVPAVEIGERKD